MPHKVSFECNLYLDENQKQGAILVGKTEYEGNFRGRGIKLTSDYTAHDVELAYELIYQSLAPEVIKRHLAEVA